MEKTVRLIATCLGIGYFPAIPGTAATAAGVALAFLLRGQVVVYAAVVIALFALGVWASGRLEKAVNRKDPGLVVIDEVVGVLIALMGLPLAWPVAVSGFFLFRAFDMFKIYPVNRLEAMSGGWGVMLDDVMAGVYTNVVLRIALWWAMGH